MATGHRESGITEERYVAAFAKGLAVFLRELGMPPSSNSSNGATAPTHCDDLPPHYVNDEWDEEEILQEFQENVQRNEALAKAGKLKSIRVTDDMVARELAPRLRAIIRARGLTQKALAEKLGVSPARISAVLKRPNKMKLDTLRRIADALGIGVREIV